MLNSNIKNTVLLSLSLSFITLSSVNAAAVIEPATEPTNVLAPYALTLTDLYGGLQKAYRPWFENGAFTGDVLEYNISAAGDLATVSNWSARVQFDAKNGTYWDDTRKVIFHDGISQKAFRWGNLSVTQQTALGGNSNVLDYIRGDKTNEPTLRARANLLGDIIHSNPVYIKKPDATFSLPGYSDFKTAQAGRAGRIYVGANDGMLHVFDETNGDEVYAYIPSMIINKLDDLSVSPLTQHAYYVDGQLAEGDAYFAIDGGAIAWHSLLVGGLGSGGKGIFALDITNPDLTSETSPYAAVDKKILWEIDSTDTDMGYIHGKPQVAHLPSGDWAIISGNGYNSSSGLAKLFIISMDGTITTEIAAGTETSNGLSAPTLVDIDGDDDVDYGYAGDLQGDLWKFDFSDNSATRIFEGSVDKPITAAPEVRIHPYRGRLIYFGTGSLLSDNDAEYKATNQSVYAIWDEAPAGLTLLKQTLTLGNYVAPDGITEKDTRLVSDDPMNWGLYNGWEVELPISGERLVTKPIMRANRLQFVTHVSTSATENGKSWLLQLNYLNGGPGTEVFLDVNGDGILGGVDGDGEPLDKSTDGKIPVGLYLGGGSFSGPTIARIDIDDDATFINALNFDIDSATCTGNCSGGLSGGHIDVDTDSPVGPRKAVDVDDYTCYVDGVRRKYTTGTSGATTAPTAVTSGGSNVERTNSGTAIWWSGSADGLGGTVDGHAHEYDNLHGVTFVDFVNLEPRCGQSKDTGWGNNVAQALERISEVNMASNKEFFVIVANADLSPYSTLQIGEYKWNVMEYQKMIQEKLDAWILLGKNNTGANSFTNMMKDDNDHSLLHKYEDFFNADDVLTGTISHSFASDAIANGGILSTKYSCVTGDAERNLSESTYKSCKWVGSGWNWTKVCSDITTYDTDRWRNGALVTQLISVSDYTTDTSRVIKQVPTDLYRSRTYKDSSGTDVTVTLKTATATYGGLRARNKNDDGTALSTANPAFLYEASLYWHNPNDICYGDTNWYTDLSSITTNSADSEIDNFSGTVGSLELDKEKASASLATLEAIPVGDRTAAQNEEILRLKRVLELLNLKLVEIQGSIGSSNESILKYSGVVKTPGSPDPDVSPSLGPNFRTGRRTWIDLTP